MVKIEEKSFGEEAREQRCKDLADVARQVFSKTTLFTVEEDQVLGQVVIWERKMFGYDLVMSVSALENCVSARRERYFQDALYLAETYEAKTGEEFTLRKNY